MYNFKKDKTKEKGVIFRNPSFQRNCPELLWNLRRQKKSQVDKRKELEEFEEARIKEEQAVKEISSQIEEVNKKIIDMEKKVQFLAEANFQIKQQTNQIKQSLLANS